VFFATGRRTPPVPARRGPAEIGRRCGLIDESTWAFTIVDAPMFEEDSEGGWTVRHPFTAPLPEWEGKFMAEPGGAGRRLRLVCNGTEIGSGSSRSTAATRQQVDGSGCPGRGGIPVRLPADALRPALPPHGGIASAGTADDAADRPGLDPRRDRVPQGRVGLDR
jgi:aspartyl-tRNA synthetase